MRAIILRAFDFSHDGVTPIHAEPAETHHIPDDLIAGLLAERFIAEAPAEEDGKSEAREPAADPEAPLPADGAADDGLTIPEKADPSPLKAPRKKRQTKAAAPTDDPQA